MGFTDSDASKCRWHQTEKQQPGVCSSCLRERLSELSNSLSFRRYRTTIVSHASSSFSSTPPYSSASSSSAAADAGHRRNGSDAQVSGGKALKSGLKKSRSVSCAPLSRSRGGSKYNVKSSDQISKIFDGDLRDQNSGIEERGENNRRKKGGFLKRFIIHSNGKKA